MSKFAYKNYFTDVHSDAIAVGIACNTPDGVQPGPTDKGMIEFIERGGTDIIALRSKHNQDKIRFPFSSKRKRMSTIIRIETSNGYDRRLLVKGASEIVKGCCSHFLDARGYRI